MNPECEQEQNLNDISIISHQTDASYDDFSLNESKLDILDLEINEQNIEPDIIFRNSYKINNKINNNTNESSDYTILSKSFENFIESIEHSLTDSQYILYDINGNKLHLSKHDVVYESDGKGNRQYYNIKDDTPLFQSIDMINQYIESNHN
jgi:hypothetical protein